MKKMQFKLKNINFIKKIDLLPNKKRLSPQAESFFISF